MSSHHSSIPRAPRPASVTYAATVGIIAGLAAATLALLGYLAGGIGGWQVFATPHPSADLSWLTIGRGTVLVGASVAMLRRLQLGRLVFLVVLLPEVLHVFVNPGVGSVAVLVVIGLAAWMVTHRQASAFFDNMPAAESLEVVLLNRIQGQQHTGLPLRKWLTGFALGGASIMLPIAVLTLDAALSAAAVPRGAFVAVLPSALLGLVLAVTAGLLWGVRRAMALAGTSIVGSGTYLVVIGGLLPPTLRSGVLSAILPGFALPYHNPAATSFFDPRIVVLGSVLVAAGLMLLWCQAYLDRKAIHTHLST